METVDSFEFEQIVSSMYAVLNSALNTIFAKYYLRPLNPRQFSRLIPVLIATCDRALRSSEYFGERNLNRPKKSKNSVSWDEQKYQIKLYFGREPGFVLYLKQERNSPIKHVVFTLRLNTNLRNNSRMQQLELLFPVIILRFLKGDDSVILVNTVAYHNPEYCNTFTVCLPRIWNLNASRRYEPWCLIWVDTELEKEREFVRTWITKHDSIQVPTFKDFCFVFSAFMQNPLP